MPCQIEQGHRPVEQLAGDDGGQALKDRQYQQAMYAGTKLGVATAPIAPRVRERLDALSATGIGCWRRRSRRGPRECSARRIRPSTSVTGTAITRRCRRIHVWSFGSSRSSRPGTSHSTPASARRSVDDRALPPRWFREIRLHKVAADVLAGPTHG